MLHLAGGRLAAISQRSLNLGAFMVGEDPVDHPSHVPLVVDRVPLGAAEQLCVLAQQPRAHRVERGRCDLACPLLAQQVGEPESQFASRADTERDAEDLVGARLLRLEQIRDPVGDGAGLARPWARDQKQRAGAVRDGLSLLGREAHE
jgi:hypothetical protein